MIFSLMNADGNHVWQYRDGKWAELGLRNQRIERMFFTPDDTLLAISDEYVCWVRKL